MNQWWTWALSVPVAGGVLGLIGTFLVPEARWTRRLSNDLAVYKDLPDGTQKAAYERRVTALAQRIIDYRELVPRSEKIGGWILLGFAALMITSFVIDGPEKTNQGMVFAYGPAWPWLAVAAAFSVVLGGGSTILGRSIYGQTPQRRAESETAERARFAAADLRRRVKKRAKRVFGHQNKK